MCGSSVDIVELTPNVTIFSSDPRRSDNNTGDLTIFDEQLHPLSKDPVPSDYDKRVPEHKHIYKFVRTLFNAAQLTAECAIVTLVGG